MFVLSGDRQSVIRFSLFYLSLEQKPGAVLLMVSADALLLGIQSVVLNFFLVLLFLLLLLLFDIFCFDYFVLPPKPVKDH